MQHFVFIPDIIYSNRFLQVLEKHKAPFHIVGKQKWHEQITEGSALSTHWLNDNDWSSEAVSNAVFSISKTFNVPPSNLRLVGLNESSVLLLGEVTARTGCAGISATTSINFRDKWTMNRVAAQAGINVPGTWLAKEIITKELFPASGVIIKPRWGVASKLVKYAATYLEYKTAIKALPGEEEYVVQQFIPGKVYFVNTLRTGNRTIKRCIGKYLNPLMLPGRSPATYVKNWIAITPDETNRELFGKLSNFDENLLDRFQYFEGCSHTEIFVQGDEELILCETAARPAGSHVQDMERYLFNRRFLFEYWAEYLCGQKPFDEYQGIDDFIGLIAFTPEKAVSAYRSVSGLTDPSIINREEIPAEKFAPGSYTSYVAKLIINCSNSIVCEQKLNELDSWFKYETLPV